MTIRRQYSAARPAEFPLGLFRTGRVVVLLASLVTAALGAPIQLRPGTNLYAAGLPLGPGSYAIPCVADWNGDGRKDLLVGYQTAGKIALYTNSGTDAQPVFTSYVNLQAGGLDIVHTSGGCGAPACWVCDFDGDGRRDLIVGAGADGTVWFYRNTNSDAAPVLAPRAQLMQGSSGVNVVLRATPYITDWDQDGLPDLLCGSGDGFVYYFRNTNTVQAPIYAPSARIQAGGADLNLGLNLRSVVRLFDWDGDGRKDLVGSSGQGVYWCRNTNSNSHPVLQAPVALQVPSSGGAFAPIYTGNRMRLDLVDWNNDGAMDLILGNVDGTVIYYEGYRFAFASPQPCAGDQFTVCWQSAPYLRYHILAGSAVTGITNQVATNLLSGGATTVWTDRPAASLRFYRVQVAP
jgi:hypothetical protein